MLSINVPKLYSRLMGISESSLKVTNVPAPEGKVPNMHDIFTRIMGERYEYDIGGYYSSSLLNEYVKEYIRVCFVENCWYKTGKKVVLMYVGSIRDTTGVVCVGYPDSDWLKVMDLPNKATMRNVERWWDTIIKNENLFIYRHAMDFIKQKPKILDFTISSELFEGEFPRLFVRKCDVRRNNITMAITRDHGFEMDVSVAINPALWRVEMDVSDTRSVLDSKHKFGDLTIIMSEFANGKCVYECEFLEGNPEYNFRPFIATKTDLDMIIDLERVLTYSDEYVDLLAGFKNYVEGFVRVDDTPTRFNSHARIAYPSIIEKLHHQFPAQYPYPIRLSRNDASQILMSEYTRNRFMTKG